MRFVRAVAAGGILLLILGGVPAGLAASIGDLRPGWSDLYASDVSDRALLAVLATVTWAAWIYFTATVLAELGALARRIGRPEKSVPQQKSTDRLARTLLGAIVFALPVAGPTHAFAARDQTIASVAPTDSASVTAAPTGPSGLTPATTFPPTAPTSPGTTMTTSPALTAIPTTAPATPTPQVSPELRKYVITRDGPGTFWELAQTFLGDGIRWKEIWALNEGREQPDGIRLRTPHLLRVGWTVLLPARPASPDSQTADPATDSSARAGTQADGPALLYIVRPGDQLSGIAQRVLGNPHAYEQIRAANPDLMPTPTGPRGADHIQPGWRLVLPPEAHDGRRRTHATGSIRHSPSRSEDDRPAVRPPSTSHPTEPASPTWPSAAPSSLPIPTTSTPAAQVQSSPPGVDIPGGWIGLPLAVTLAAAGYALWIRRRMVFLYPPSQDQDKPEDDTDLQALPTVMTHLRRAVRAHAAALPDAFSHAQIPSDPGFPPIETPVRDAPALGDLPSGGVGVSGPGAPAALRAFLVDALSTPGRPTEPAAITTRQLLTILLPNWPTAGADPTGRLAIADDQDEAHELFVECLRSQEQAPEGEADDAATPAPPVLLIETPGQPSSPLVKAIDAGATVSARTVLLGKWSLGASLTVEADGYVSHATIDEYPHRLAVLDEKTTLDLLPLLKETDATRRPPRPGIRRDYLPPNNQADHGADAQQALETTQTAGVIDEPLSPGTANADDPQTQLTTRRVSARLLGPPVVLGPAGSPVTGLRRRATELLVYLAVHRTGARLPEIMEALWPDATVRRAQERLSTEVANLRRIIRIAAGDTGIQPVVNTGGHYHLDPETLDIDLWRLVDHLDAGARATDTSERAEHLRAALDIPGGVLAENSNYDWIDVPREQLRRRSIRALLSLADHPDTTAQEAAELITRAADLDPASDDLAQRAMRALATIGDTEAIPERMERLRKVLRDIGEHPTAQTIALADELTITPKVPL